MAKRRRAACGCLFVPRRNVPHQCYCSQRACQRTRRRRWQRQKRPEYTERNREGAPGSGLVRCIKFERNRRWDVLKAPFHGK